MMNVISNGVDILEVKRMEKILKKDNDNFINKVFTTNEINYFEKVNYSPQTVAGYFCTKEATMKVLKSGFDKIHFKDIEIIKKDNAPYILLHGNAKKIALNLSIKEILVSISQEKKYAIAFAVGVS